ALALSGAVGILRLPTFIQRMHPPALGSTLGAWSVCAASIIWFSTLASAPLIHTWVIPILLCISVPITTRMLSRTALFRLREAGADAPAPLSGSPRIPPGRAGSARERGDPGREV